MFDHMVRSFDFWFIMFIIVKGLFSAGMLCEWDIRMIPWFFIATALTWFIMIDTFHINYRNSSYISVLGILWSFMVSCFSKFNTGETFKRDRFMEINGVHLVSAKISLVSSTLSACIFFVRFLWSYHRNRNRIFFISENIRVEQITPESWDFLCKLLYHDTFHQ